MWRSSGNPGRIRGGAWRPAPGAGSHARPVMARPERNRPKTMRKCTAIMSTSAERRAPPVPCPPGPVDLHTPPRRVCAAVTGRQQPRLRRAYGAQTPCLAHGAEDISVTCRPCRVLAAEALRLFPHDQGFLWPRASARSLSSRYRHPFPEAGVPARGGWGGPGQCAGGDTWGGRRARQRWFARHGMRRRRLRGSAGSGMRRRGRECASRCCSGPHL